MASWGWILASRGSSGWAHLRNLTKDLGNLTKRGTPCFDGGLSDLRFFDFGRESCARGNFPERREQIKMVHPILICEQRIWKVDACPCGTGRFTRPRTKNWWTCGACGQHRMEEGGFGFCSSWTEKSNWSYGPNLDDRI